MPLASPEFSPDPTVGKDETGIASALQGALQGFMMGQQFAAREQQIRLQREKANRDELSFDRALALQDAEVASGLSPLGQEDIGSLLAQVAKGARGTRARAGGPDQAAAVEAADGGLIAQELDRQAFEREQAGRQSAAAKRDLSTAEDEAMAAEFEAGTRQKAVESRQEVDALNADRLVSALVALGGQAPGGGVVAGGIEGAPLASEAVPQQTDLSQAVDMIRGFPQAAPIQEQGDQFGRALLELDEARVIADAAAARTASLETGLANPAVEFGATEQNVLDPGAVATAVLRFRRTGDPSIFEVFGGQVPADLNGIVGRVTDFAREVNRRKIQAFIDSQEEAGEEAVPDPIDFSDTIRSAGVTDEAEVARLNDAVNATLTRAPRANPASIIGALLEGHSAQQRHGFTSAEEEGRRQTKKTPSTNITISPARTQANELKRQDLVRKTLRDVDDSTFRSTKLLLDNALFSSDPVVKLQARNALKGLTLQGSAAEARDDLLVELGGTGDPGGPDQSDPLGSKTNPHRPTTQAEVDAIPRGEFVFNPADGRIAPKR